MKSSSRKSSASKKSLPGKEMKGADIVVQCLEREGVDTMFVYPGGAALELNQALTKSKKIRTILPRHEQGGVFAATGYARASGKVGVCLATSGPGATNLISGIADAYMDSVPLVAITGQVFQQFIGKQAFQETDFFGMTLPIVKHSYLVLDAKDLPRIFKEAFEIAKSGRPGPVVIDIPKDVQQARIVPEFPSKTNFANSNVTAVKHASDAELKKLLELVSKAKRPVLYVGGGIVSADACDELRVFAKKTGIPVATTLMGAGVFPETDPLSLHWFGMHGSVYGNWAVDQSDLLITVGARFDDRITGDTSTFAKNAKVVQIDVDSSEHNKNKHVDMAILSDAKYALKRLNVLMASEKTKIPDTKQWLAQLAQWKRDYPFSYGKNSKHILPQEAVEMLYELTKGDAIIVTGVGQHQMWAAQYYRFDKPRRFVSSLGLGAMGYGYPAALGAKVAFPKKQVVDIDGDGSFTMNIQELATAKIEKIGAKAMILNNQHLGMVVQWEDRFYGGTRGNTLLTDPKNLGHADNLSGLYPDFVKIAEGFGVKARRVIKRSELRDAIKEMLAHEGPYVLDVITSNTEHVLPMVPAGKGVSDIILE